MISFVHVPRTGGTAAWSHLGRHGYPVNRRGAHLQHIRASRLRELQPERWDRGVVIGVFRDPHERLISLWSFLFRDYPSDERSPRLFRRWVENGMKGRDGHDPVLYEDEPDEESLKLVAPQAQWLDDADMEVVVYTRSDNPAHRLRGIALPYLNGGWWDGSADWYDAATREKARPIVEPDLDFISERRRKHGV